MSNVTTARPLLVGAFALYTSDRCTALQVVDLVMTQGMRQGFGTVILRTGEEIDWVDMQYNPH